MSSASALLAANNLYLSTSSESAARVANVFPDGPATENARAAIGAAAPPPETNGPDATTQWIAQLTPAAPISAETLHAAMPVRTNAKVRHHVQGKVVGSDKWLSEEAPPGTEFDRIDVSLDIVSEDKTITAADIDRETAYAKALGRRVRAGEPSFPVTTAQALVIANDAVATRKLFSDEDLDVGFTVRPKASDHFAGKLIWDVVYSAGFTWGDGDYFHWVPSPTTDESQGIGMGTSTDPGYFLPESIAQNGGDVEDVEMSFNVARTYKPLEMLDVMTRIGAYVSRRLNGSLVNDDGSPWEAKKVRARVAVMDAVLTAHGVSPGSNLALGIF